MAFIVIEGIDGSGKTTLTNHLSLKIKETKNQDICQLFEPTKSSEWGVQVRSLLATVNSIDITSSEYSALNLQMLDLYKKDRLYNIEYNIKPNLAQNKHIVQDRYFLSTAAYQGTTLKDVDTIMESYMPIVIIPDIIFFLDIDYKHTLERINLRNEGDQLFEKEILLQRIQKNYNYIFDTYSKKLNIIKIDALQSQEAILQIAYKQMVPFLNNNENYNS